MRSLAATTAAAHSALAAGPGRDNGIGERLQRLVELLGIAGARLSSIAADGLVVVATAGEQVDLSGFESRAAATSQPLVIGETGQPAARFYVGITVPGSEDRPAQLLSLFDQRPRSPMMAATIAAMASEVLAHAAVERLHRQIEEQKRVIADYAALEQQRRCLFDRASATARIGIWQCNLADESLIWTNGVYDLFEVPRDTPVTRETTMALYTERSRLEMQAARSHAIATCSDFSLDAEIVTTTGKHRWMRLTGAVESRNGVAHRIFGMKQDITEEKLMADQTRYLAEFDVMTGLANRSQFQARLAEMDAGIAPMATLLLVDLDGFKQINDTHGHAVGDQCLREAALRLTACCGAADLVARIGGDEFAVLLDAGMPMGDIEALADVIVSKMAQPVMLPGQTVNLGASVGIARFTGGSSDDLFRQADTALYAAKAAGRNTRRSFAA